MISALLISCTPGVQNATQHVATDFDEMRRELIPNISHSTASRALPVTPFYENFLIDCLDEFPVRLLMLLFCLTASGISC
jgi:hypothetical protein